jgi:hypothetical protein
MNPEKALRLMLGAVFGAALANAGTLTFTCDPGVAAATCSYLNTTIAGNYSSTFTNASANIYIQYGTTSLASATTGVDNQVTYSQYSAALAAQAIASGNPVQVSAVAALTSYDALIYGSGNVDLTSALANALGIGGDVAGGNAGITGPGGTVCFTPGGAGCYSGIITVTNDVSTPLYYDNLGGTEPSNAYDFYGTVEHEVDELLGTVSCVTTTTTPLSNDCAGNNTPSAVDLFRYSSSGNLAPDNSLSTTPGAYFSYNGGATNGAIGIGGSPKFYNTLDNGDDYADFISSSPDCGTNQTIQDAEGCPGEDAGLTIKNDGGAEINILNAIGYDVHSTASTPEPGTMTLLGAGLAGLAVYRLRRRT